MNKGKVMLSMVIIIIALALSLGATMAWFQDEDPASPATFQAGTVIIEAVGTYSISGGDGYKNVNPGDCFVLCWEFENKGSKTVELRTQIDPVWIDVTELNDNVFILPQYASDWVLHEDGGDLWAYYLGGPVASEETVQLCLVVYFDGPLTDYRYQGKEFTMNGEVEAVQASNNAPSEVWGTVWDDVNVDGYEFNYTQKWPTFDLSKIDCYSGENGGTVSYGEHYVGFEDATDFDYSDFGMAFTLTENYNSDNELESITMVFNALSYTANHNHYIRLAHTGLTGDYSYEVTRNYTAEDNETPEGTYDSTDDLLEEVILFDTNRYTYNKNDGKVNGSLLPINDSVTIVLTLDTPIALSPAISPRQGLAVDDIDPALYYYNFSLENLNTNVTYNMSDTENNYSNTGINVPRVIVVPETGFVPPADTVPMNTAYPEFNNYYGGDTDYSNWYENPDTSASFAW